MKKCMVLLAVVLCGGSLLGDDVPVNLIDGFMAEFDAPEPTKNVEYFSYGSGGNQADFTWYAGVESAREEGTRTLALTMDSEDAPGAWQGPNMNTGFTQFGTYATRVRIPHTDDQPNVGGVVGFYTFYNDEWAEDMENDWTGTGLYDNSEIDFEWLIADPEVLYLSAYTDYHGPTGETRQVSRILNLAEGHIYSTTYRERLGSDGVDLHGAENYPETIPAIENFNAADRFYTYGFDWEPDRIRWWILHPETKDTVVLWDYQGPQERITQKPARLMLNIWHTDSWSVITNPHSTEAPQADTFSVEFDWVSYDPLDDETGAIVHEGGHSASSLVRVEHGAEGGVLHFAEKGVHHVVLYDLAGARLAAYSVGDRAWQLPRFTGPVILGITSSTGRQEYRRIVPRP
ncbi:glycoside hydrolase family 16 protein [Chitinivibrio alkaliphilus]|nr:glycoside hydrolase family 16 protein [Chitinivibrio alkaliphilus]